MRELKHLLGRVKVVLQENGEQYFASIAEDALSGSDEDLKSFIVSNELWGGAGSVADQACGENRESRRLIESALIRLGAAQIQQGITNVRTAMWVDAFRQWQCDGI